MVSGLGVFTSGILLTVVGFPQGARPGAVDPKVIHDMAALYLPVVVTLYLAAIGTLFAFRLDKQTHEENLRKLASDPKAV